MLTLLGFEGTRECWITQNKAVISWCKTWFIGGYDLNLCELDSARENYFLTGYDSWLEMQTCAKNIIDGLIHCVLHELIPVITSYSSAMLAVPMPSPRNDTHLIFPGWLLSSFRRDYASIHEEKWSCADGELTEQYSYCIIQAIWCHGRKGTYTRPTCSSLAHVVLNTRRAQILGLRHDKLA